MDVIVTNTSEAIIADPRISNNPGLRSSAAHDELRALQDELLLRWQVKWTEAFLANGHNMTKEEIAGYEDADSALDFASKALDSYKHELACCEEREPGIQNLENYSNQGNKRPHAGSRSQYIPCTGVFS